jgi:hypothetical protein
MATVHRFPIERRLPPDQHEQALARALADVEAAEEALRLARSEARRVEALARLARGGAGLLTAPQDPAAADARQLWAWASKWPEGHPLRGLLQRAAERAEASTNPSPNPGVPAPEFRP